MENKQFFDPYNINSMPSSHVLNPAQISDDNFFHQINQVTPTMFYEQQFWYYNYLTKMLEYKMKLKEYENMSKKAN